MNKLFYNIFDKITGFNINSELEKVLEFETFSSEKINDYQQNQFQLLKEFAKKSKFYKGFEKKDITEFPIITKALGLLISKAISFSLLISFSRWLLFLSA